MTTEQTKQRAELIDKLERLHKGLLLIGSSIDAETCQEAITALKQKEWVKVEDGLPDENKKVLCTNEFNHFVIKSWMEYTGSDSRWFRESFTHWKYIDLTPPTES